MSLSSFDLHREDTRLVKHQNCVYKVKVTFSGVSETVPSSLQEAADSALEQVFRAVLYAEERDKHLSVIETDDFFVFFSKKYWKTSEKLGFKYNRLSLRVYPHVLIFRVSLKGDGHFKSSRHTDVINKQSTTGIDSTRKTSLSGSRNGKTSEETATVLKQTDEISLGDQSVRHEKSTGQSSKQKEIEHFKTKSKHLKSSHVPVSSESDKRQSVVSLTHRLRSAKRDGKLLQTEHSKSKTDSAKLRKSPRLCQSASENQAVGMESEVTGVDELPNIISSRRTRLIKSIKQGHVSTDSFSKLRKTKTPSPKRASRRQIIAQNKNNSNCWSDRTDVIQTRRATRNDRHLIESEAFTENMKLQSLASSRSLRKSPRKRRRSGLWDLVESIATPIKRLITGK